jgi:ATP-dependent helicase HrpB
VTDNWLPIDEAVPDLRRALAARNAAVLQAPPGAGKTTRVPLALLDERWLAGRKIVMLEPRRLAARAAARRMAWSRGEDVGQGVGYRVRLDTRVGPATRIEVVTEGILTRMLQSDPTFADVGLVIFDEFHERSLNADLGLALTLHTQRLLRDDLRILVMSATLDTAPVATLLDDAAVVSSEGQSFPVATHYSPPAAGGRREWPAVESQVVSAIATTLRDDEGDVLVFLPGTAEIRRVDSQLGSRGLPPGVQVTPLFGDLSPEAQDRAILPNAHGLRKVVLATSIAETSLTIEGVRVVVDAGLARVPRFSPRTGMSRLETVRVSRASAEQRRGRAGRLAPGVCYRLWTELEQEQLLPRATPEILEADLAPLALELATAGILDPGDLRWLDPPPGPALAQAHELLIELEAIDDDGRATAHGQRMAEYGLHPRLAHMLLTAKALGAKHAALACELAALLGERDPLRSDAGPPEADLRLRVDALHAFARRDSVDPRVNRDTLRRARAAADQLRRQLGVRDAPADVEEAGILLALAYPDRIGQRRESSGRGDDPGRFLLRNGRGAALATRQTLSVMDFLVAVELDDRRPESRIFLAAPVTLDELESQFDEQIVGEDIVAWDDATDAVVARHLERLGAIVIRERPLRDPDPERVAHVLVERLLRDGIAELPWSENARELRARLTFLHRVDPSWPDVSDGALGPLLREWIAPRVHGIRRRDQLGTLDLATMLKDQLTRQQRAALEQLAPTHLEVPSGARVPIDYSDPESPILAVRLQELFGLADTPLIAGGRVPVTLHILSPARRPVQVTRDLAGFWRTSYFDVRRDLRGRYPKHDWPEDPLRATAKRVPPRSPRAPR